jgi:hypothetical protein
MRFRKTGSASRSSSLAGVLLTVLLVIGIFRVGVDKNLVGTFTDNEWGRYLFAMGAALTQLKGGPGGYVIDNVIETKLGMGGLTAMPEVLEPLGTKFPDNLRSEALMQRALEGARDVDVPPPPEGDYTRLRGSHGDDVGLATFASLAFLLFGVKVSSLYYMFFALLAATVILFFVSHGRSRGAMACLALMVLALYVLCLSDFVNLVQQVPPYAGSAGSDIKDPRFFGALAVVPTLHFLLTWVRRDYRLGVRDYLVLIAQASILTFAIHVRWSTLWMVGAVFAFFALAIAREGISGLRRLGEWRRPRSAFVAGVLACVIGGELAGISMAAHPVYRLDGDLLHHPVWHNILTSLHHHPDWDTRYAPSVKGAGGDAMPLEVAWQGIAALPPDQRARYLYAHINHPNPEAVMFFARQRFLQILRDDPWFVAETYFIYQPKIIVIECLAWFYAALADLSAVQALTIFAALAIIAWLAAADPEAPFILGSLTAIAGVFSLIALLSILIGPHPLNMVDHFLWFLFFLGAAACWAGVYLARLVPAGSLLPRVLAHSRAAAYFNLANLVIIFCAAALCYEMTSIVYRRLNAEMSLPPAARPADGG